MRRGRADRELAKGSQDCKQRINGALHLCVIPISNVWNLRYFLALSAFSHGTLFASSQAADYECASFTTRLVYDTSRSRYPLQTRFMISHQLLACPPLGLAAEHTYALRNRRKAECASGMALYRLLNRVELSIPLATSSTVENRDTTVQQ